MGRAGIVIDETELRNVLFKAEKENKFNSRSELFEFVCTMDWSQRLKDSLGRPASLSPPVLYQRIKQFGIDLQTPMGKRGRSNIHESANPADRKSRCEKFANSPAVQEAHVKLTEYMPNSYSNLVNRVKRGSAVAAIKLKCLDCANFQPKEIKYCPITDCPLWAFRPYRTGEGEE